MHWKRYVLVIHKILRLFVKKLTVDGKHYLLNIDNLTRRIQMQLSQTQKAFNELFFAYLKSLLNFQHLPKKDDSPSGCFYGNNGSEKYD